jgi:hypothetical protein
MWSLIPAGRKAVATDVFQKSKALIIPLAIIER